MKELISEQEFLMSQPSFPKKTPTDRYFFRLSNRLMDLCTKEKLLADHPDSIVKKAVLSVVDYFQDILSDAGIFRSFTEEHRRLYGRWLPFYSTDSKEYIPHELNPEDIRFIIWYTIALYSDGEARKLNPMDENIRIAADRIHHELNRLYDDADTPVPETFNLARGLDLDNPEEADEIFHFGNWLFLSCYLMKPAFAMTLSEIIHNLNLEVSREPEKLTKALEESMMEDPTGPLALYLREWIFLILRGKMPPEHKVRNNSDEEDKRHPYYQRVMDYTGGSPIVFFHDYETLNRFFINVLGWEDEENLPALKSSKDFVVLVNREKGMLVARNVAACIRMEGNPCYDEAYAKIHAIDLLTERGLCPPDLLHYLFSHDALPDAHFPGSDTYNLVHENRDFIARCYLQKYYRGD